MRAASLGLFFFFYALAFAQPPGQTDRIDETRLRRLAGNTRPEANAANDRGRAADDLVLDHMLLQLKRTPERQQELDQLIGALHDKKSPSFHHWLTAREFGSRFGASAEDIAAVSAWLQSHGLRVNAVYPSGLLIDFSGSAGQVRAAFHTEIHALEVNGARHAANMSDPLIPEALAHAVSGVASLNDFKPHPMARPRANFTLTSGGYIYEAVTPGDLAAIYDVTPLFANGITGAGQTIAVIEDTDLYSTADWDAFRSAFGLSQYSSGSLASVHPSGANFGDNCADPGVPAGGDDGEAALDAEWASAAAPDAAIQVASCASTRFTWGGLIAIANLINSDQPPSILSLSYGQCEAENGAAANSAFALAFQQAVAEGISVFVAAGDEGAAGCDAGASAATHGIAVSGFASTPYDVAVGGTDFSDSLDGANANYWNSSNSSIYTSALSYIPEIPWNDSCASGMLSAYFGYSAAYGIAGFCASPIGQHYFQNVIAGSGGPSNCAAGSSATFGVSGGTCLGFAKPDWQAAPGIPGDGVRDLPDVSMFAADGLYGHYLVFCWSDAGNGGASCAGDPASWPGGGGTSFATPVMAGIQALINQHAGGAQGNPNYVYYRLAVTGSCDSANGTLGVSGCVFHNVSRGDIDVNCGGDVDCYGATRQMFGRRGGASEGNGALSVDNQNFAPAYGAAGGWNFATGLGSVDAYNLVNAWTAAP